MKFQKTIKQGVLEITNSNKLANSESNSTPINTVTHTTEEKIIPLQTESQKIIAEQPISKQNIVKKVIKPTPTKIIIDEKPKQKESLKIRINKLFKPKVFNISTTITDKGLHFSFKTGSQHHEYDINFPEESWKEFPYNYKLLLRDNLAHLSFLDLGIMHNIKKLNYDTPLPLFKSFFMEVILRNLLFYGDCDSVKTVEYITRLCNLELSFKGDHSPPCTFGKETKERAINTLTFGKESLLGWGLAKELGLDPVPVTIIEPDLNTITNQGERIISYENKHKNALIVPFEKEFNTKVYKIINDLGEIRCYANWGVDETDLGWSTILTQYLFLLLPINYKENAKYMIFGNENDDCYYVTKDGFRCNPAYEQTKEWMKHMNTMLHNVTQSEVQPTSLVQPLHEIAVCKILYQRYPDVAKYQMSCPDGAKNQRWCCNCHKCATCFIFMKAHGYDPALAGLPDMLSNDYKELFPLFTEVKEGRTYYSSGLVRDELLFSFLLATKKGATGDLIDNFKENYMEEAIQREKELRNYFFNISPQFNIPPHLWKKLKPIFEEELAKE